MEIETTEAKANAASASTSYRARGRIAMWVILVIHLVALVCLLTDLIYHYPATPPTPARAQVVFILLAAAMTAIVRSNVERLEHLLPWVQGIFWSLYLLTKIV